MNPSAAPVASAPDASCAVVAIGASAGGVAALREVVSGLPPGLPPAVFIVLHLPAHRVSDLAAVLQRATTLAVSVAVDGQPIEAGHVYVAPPDRHLVLHPGLIRLTRGPRECRVRPAVDVLFRSAASAYSSCAIGGVLSGAPDDGTAGLWAIKDCGGIALVQDPATAEFPSMPESACRFVEVDSVLPLAQIGREITHRVSLLRSAEPLHAAPSEKVRIETAIAVDGNGIRNGVLKLGSASGYTCPECHRALVRIEDGPIVRFRCHSGHAYSTSTLLTEINGSIDRGIWDAVRDIEERGLLLRDIGMRAARAGHATTVTRCTSQAEDADRRARVASKLAARSPLLRPRTGRHERHFGRVTARGGKITGWSMAFLDGHQAAVPGRPYADGTALTAVSCTHLCR